MLPSPCLRVPGRCFPPERRAPSARALCSAHSTGLQEQSAVTANCTNADHPPVEVLRAMRTIAIRCSMGVCESGDARSGTVLPVPEAEPVAVEPPRPVAIRRC